MVTWSWLSSYQMERASRHASLIYKQNKLPLHRCSMFIHMVGNCTIWITLIPLVPLLKLISTYIHSQNFCKLQIVIISGKQPVKVFVSKSQIQNCEHWQNSIWCTMHRRKYVNKVSIPSLLRVFSLLFRVYNLGNTSPVAFIQLYFLLFISNTMLCRSIKREARLNISTFLWE